MLLKVISIWVPLYQTLSLDRSDANQVYNWLMYWTVVSMYQNTRPYFAWILDTIPYINIVECGCIACLQLNGVSESLIGVISRSKPVIWLRSWSQDSIKPMLLYLWERRNDPKQMIEALYHSFKRIQFVARKAAMTKQAQELLEWIEKIIHPLQENAMIMGKFLLDSWKESGKVD